MSDQLDATLAAQLRKWAKHAPAEKLAFVVTLAPGHAPRTVLPFVPTTEVERSRTAAGAMTAAQALALADDARIERIELDGEAHALTPPSDDEPND